MLVLFLNTLCRVYILLHETGRVGKLTRRPCEGFAGLSEKSLSSASDPPTCPGEENGGLFKSNGKELEPTGGVGLEYPVAVALGRHYGKDSSAVPGAWFDGS